MENSCLHLQRVRRIAQAENSCRETFTIAMSKTSESARDPNPPPSPLVSNHYLDYERTLPTRTCTGNLGSRLTDLGTRFQHSAAGRAAHQQADPHRPARALEPGQ